MLAAGYGGDTPHQSYASQMYSPPAVMHQQTTPQQGAPEPSGEEQQLRAYAQRRVVTPPEFIIRETPKGTEIEVRQSGELTSKWLRPSGDDVSHQMRSGGAWTKEWTTVGVKPDEEPASEQQRPDSERLGRRMRSGSF
jgi:hypothetical protein